jgi:UDP-N-acetylmuramoyl-L-alanyl-D-glutamate--2,6-diaminopimelate ligase
MTLDELLALVSSDGQATVRIDSRRVRAGDVFVAIRGPNRDGHDFIGQAVAAGARYIVCERGRTIPDSSGPAGKPVLVRVANPAAAAGQLAQAAQGNPAAQLTNLAVTGTNGKTTITFLVRACIEAAGGKCGLMGTVVYDTGSGITSSSLTTPDCLTIAEAQRRMVEGGARYMVIEASSHALSQHRLAGVNFRAAAFTNLTGDHLDYHKTKEDYLAAKTRLFTALTPEATAVLNRQVVESESIARATKARICWYAVDETADLSAHVESMTVEGTEFILEHRGRKERVKTPLLGRYNVANHLAAAGLCLGAGLDLSTVAAGLSSLKGVPGRLERVSSNGEFTVLVDYAHTDDALQNVLTTLKPLCRGRLIAVFGCGGDRDKTKRPRMAAVVERLADVIFVTSDNPRTEKPEAIIGDIMAGFRDPSAETVMVEPDRRRAIERAIETARPDDIVLLAGKGHETYQIVGDQRFDFSDKDIARQCLARMRHPCAGRNSSW